MVNPIETLSQGLGDLENVYFEENAYLETLYNHEQPEVDMHFKSIVDAKMILDKKELLKSLKQEKTKMHSHYANKHKLVEHLSSSRWKSSGTWNRGSNSKSTIWWTFLEGKNRTWKRALFIEGEDIRRELEVEFCRILQQQRLKFESEIKGYEHDISVLKYQKEQLEKCFSLEMQTLKLKFDHDKLEIGNRFKNEKDLKRVLKGQYERKLSGDKLRIEWLLWDQFQLGRRASTAQLDSNDLALSTSSIYSDLIFTEHADEVPGKLNRFWVKCNK